MSAPASRWQVAGRVGPRRIVCLTEETTELLYLLGEQDRIVGITAYTERPPQAKTDKPVVSAFIGGSLARIQALQPDLVVGFSDVQADYARQLIHAGLPVLITNQRSVAEILDVMQLLAAMVGAQDRATALVDGWRRGLDATYARGQALQRQGGSAPRVYFEEWNDPMISCIRWVSELIEVAGGQNVFAEQALAPASKDRVVTVEQVVAAQPDVLLASWCGKPLDRHELETRFDGQLPCVQADRVVEIAPEVILQPGPACLTDGLAAVHRAIWEGVD